MHEWYLTERASEAQDLRRGHAALRKLEVDPFVIEGIYHPHLVEAPGSYPIECSQQDLGQTYMTRIAGFDAEVSMPRLDVAHRKSGGPLGPPLFKLLGPQVNWSDWTFPAEPHRPKWGSLNGPVTIRDLRIAIAPGDSSIGVACAAVHDGIAEWWSLTKSWIEVLSSQDLEGLDKFHWSHGSVTLWSRDPSGKRRNHPGRSRITNAWRPDMGFGYVNAMCSAVHAAGCGHAVPLEWQMVREALRAFQRGQYRRVLMECGLAAEIALRAHLIRNNEPPEPGAWLGRLVSSAKRLAKDQRIVPPDFIRLVVEERNLVMHVGKLPTATEAVTAFDLTMALVEGASPRERLREPYGLILRTDPPMDSRETE